MKIGTIVKQTSCSQSNFFMNETLNRFLNTHVSPVCFYLNLSSLSGLNQYALMNVSYAAGFFDGVLIATCLDSAKVLKNINTNAKKYLYLQDLEWLRSPVDFMENHKLLNSFDLISRSKSHALVIENYANKSSLIIEDWNYEQIKGLIDDFRKHKKRL